MNINSPKSSTPSSQQRGNALRSAIVLLVAALLNLVVASRPAIQSGYWQAWVDAGTILLFLIAIITSIVLIRRGSVERGVSLLLTSFLVTLLVRNAMTNGMGMLLGLIALTITSAIAFYTLPPGKAIRWAVAGMLAGVFYILFDLYAPAYRQPAPADIRNSLPFVAVIAALVMIALVIRRALAGNIFIKLMVAFVVVILLGVGILASVNVRTYRLGLTESVGDSLTKLADAQGYQIATALEREMAALTTLSLSRTIQNAARSGNQTANVLTETELNQLDQQWREANAANNIGDPLVTKVIYSSASDDLRSFRLQFTRHAEIFVTGTQGFNVAASDRTSDYNQSDEEWWQATNRDGRYIGQPEYDESSGVTAIIMSVAIRELGDNRIIGILRTTVDLTSLINTLATSTIGETGRSIILLPDGKTIRVNINEAGTYELVQEDMPPELMALSQSTTPYQALTLSGIPVLAAIADMRTIAGDPATTQLISNMNWRVITTQDSAEALQVLEAQTRSGLILSTLVIFLGILAAFIMSRVIANPITRLNNVAQKIVAGDLNAQAEVETRDEIGTLAATFNNLTRQLRDFINTLESRVAERTKSLELAAEVGRSVSRVRALDVMLREAAEIIRLQFDLYYVQVYLANPAQNTLLIKSGTGTVGAELVGRGHQLPLDTGSINGRAAIEKRSVVISDTAASSTFRPNPLLPDTRSEMAVPLMIGDKVVGVLDLQSQQADALNQDLLPAFEALAGQLAIAIQNANLLAETEEARTEVEKQAQRLNRLNWEDYLDAIHKPEKTGFVYEQNQVKPLDEMQETEPLDESAVIRTPITITGEALGTLVVETENQTPQNVELVQIIARQVAQQIENLRLLESAERYRTEVENAARRTTVEGWKQYVESRSGTNLRYLYDSNTVRPDTSEHQIGGSTFDLPIKARDETVGKLSVFGYESPDSNSLEFASAVVERLGAHIDSLRLFEETKQGQIELDKRARQLAAVAEISTASSRELDINKMLHTVVHLTQRAFGLYHTHIFVYNEKSADLKIAACGWREGDIHEGTDDTAVIPLDQEQSLVARAARTRQAVIANDVRAETSWLPNPFHPDTASEMAVPLVIGEELLGVLDVQSEQLNAFNDEDANIQTTLAAQVATSLQNARSYTQAQQQAERESMLNAISQKIQGATSVEAVLQIAARELGHALGAPLTIAQLGVKDGSK